MSLQVWLPLNGDLHNQGLSNVSTIAKAGVTIDTNGKLGQCYNFASSATGNLTLSSQINVSIINGTTVAAWVYLNGTNSDRALFSNQSGGPVNFSFEINSSKLSVYHYNGSWTRHTGTTALSAGVWYHIAYVCKNSKCTFYINGVPETTIVDCPISSNYSGKIPVDCLGSRWSNGAPFAGKINDFRLYDHALSPKEIKEISKGLILYYKLDNNNVENYNILTGTYYNSYGTGLAAASTARNIDGKWAAGSGGNGTFSVTEDSTCPIGSYSWNVLNNTSGNRDFQQGDQPYVSGQKYTTSFYAKGNGTCLYRSWNSTDGKQMFQKTWTLTSNWTKYTYTFTASEEMETDSCTFHLGVTGSANISICGMKMELGEKATPYCAAKGEVFDDAKVYDSSGYNYNGTIVGTTVVDIKTPKNNIATQMNNTSSSNHIEIDSGFIMQNDALTVSFWIKGAKSTNQVFYASPNVTIGSLNSLIYVCPTSAAGFATTHFVNNDWNHIVAIRTNDTYQLYINGEPEAQNGANNYYLHNISTPWLLNRNYNNSYAANATISDFRIYCTALSAEDIKELYNTSKLIDNQGNKLAREVNSL